MEIDEQELNNYRITIHNNTLTSMQVFIEAAEKFGYEFTEEEQVAFWIIFSHYNSGPREESKRVQL